VLIGLVVTIVLWLPLPTVAPGNLFGMSHEGRRALLHFFIGITVTEVLMGRSKSRTSIGSEAVRVSLAVLLGYFGPSLFGLGAAWLISRHYPLSMVWLGFAALGVLLYIVGMSFGWLSIPVIIALSYVVLRYHHDRQEVVFEYAIGWLLLAFGVRLALGHTIRVAARPMIGIISRLPMLVSLLWLGSALTALPSAETSSSSASGR